MRITRTFTVENKEEFKESLLLWAQQYDEVVWLDSNGHSDPYGCFDALLAVDGLTALSTDYHSGFEDLATYQAQVKDWIFGYLTYDLKNDVEVLTSKNNDGLAFPELYFFQPKKVIRIRENKIDFIYLNMVSDELETDFEEINQHTFNLSETSIPKEDIRIRMRIFKDEYFRKVWQMLAHIQNGDLYEANFCQEFYAENCTINPLGAFKKLNAISKAPFSAYLKLSDKYLCSASPERYLKKMGNKVISQPIKGTAARNGSITEDTELKMQLEQDEKERSENIMIVDLVRNDLSKSALKGSVTVEELCKVYSFEQVHQMVSIISATVAPDKNPVELIKETFPMGSMTGAPKISAMKIIEELESSRRGLYSGAVGYFTPNSDFDFNVVIRSILYNESKKYVSYSVGSAITAKSNPNKEYEECLLKAKAMREVIEG
ncbi:anthranilate synthase component I family protein [Maribacter aestuarii]|uniref:anthranilate synthase component I family protein n=1 Tax=Maribacter aestuarii TaxID=1130723 RepID=UPI00248B0C13|nr:anthranilate synthase component I family protein [Maribacter aestuarii]